MESYSFLQIRDSVLQWADNYLKSNKLFMQVAKNEKDILILDLTFENCLAQITVNNPYFAPYKNVLFEALEIENTEPGLIYFFYGFDGMSIEDITRELDLGIKYCFNYIPGRLEKIYTGKTGLLDFKGIKTKMAIHPDDWKKCRQIPLKEEFTCTGTMCQYLITENNYGTIRVLPEVFKIRRL